MSRNPFTSRTEQTFSPPVMEARRWIEGVNFDEDRPLLNVSQAAPVDAPPAPLLNAMCDIIMHDAGAHLYGPVLGLPDLRQEIATQWSEAYNGHIRVENTAITSGCNQAFAAVIASLCGEGDNVLLPLPYYFNHQMWLDMAGVSARYLTPDDNLLPSVEDARAAITDRTRAIVLVTPNNPTGVEYPSGLVEAFYDLCKERGIKLIVDETYRDFDSRAGAPHSLFEHSDWENTLIQLYSFSKAYRLTGHRVGSVIASPELLAQMERFLDTVTICANQIGQRAALWGLQNLGDWVAGERLEILNRRAAIEENFDKLAARGWRLLGCGAYFAYVEHPFDMPSDELAPRLVEESAVLLLPGTMFMPEGDPRGTRQLRIAFANVDSDGIAELFDRLATVDLPRLL